jgi:hypothetical protein
VAQEVEHLPSKLQVLNSSPSTTKKKKKKEEDADAIQVVPHGYREKWFSGTFKAIEVEKDPITEDP